MTAKKYLVSLWERPGMFWLKRNTKEVHVDPADDKRLLELLKEHVISHRGNDRVDLSRWAITIHKPTGLRARVARLDIDPSGRPKVSRP